MKISGELRDRLKCGDCDCACQDDERDVGHCPFPERHTNGDTDPSFGLRAGKCFADCCTSDEIKSWLKTTQNGSRGPTTEDDEADQGPGLTLRQYLEEKGLDEQIAEDFSLSDGVGTKARVSVVKIPYFDRAGKPHRVKVRHGSGARFNWASTKQSAFLLYGLQFLDHWPAEEPVILVEGETDVITLFQAGYLALGVPGAAMWKKERAADLEGRKVIIWPDQDKAGHQLEQQILRDLPEARVIKPPPGSKDANQLWLSTGQKTDAFQEIVDGLIDKAAPGELDDPFAPTDVGNAERLIKKHGENLRHSFDMGKWLVWTGTHWQIDAGALINRHAISTVKSIEDERWSEKSQSSRAVDALIKLAREAVAIEVDKEVDRGIYLLNVKNGTLDLRTGTLREHRREDYITRVIPVEYDAAARAPRWQQFLKDVQPDPEVRAFLKQAVGYSLTGDISEHVLLFLHGEGANGKSTFIDTLLLLLPGYARLAAPGLIYRKDTDHSTDIADLYGARLVVGKDISADKLNESFIKSATGDSRAKGRWMHGNNFEFDQTYKFWLTGNRKPRVSLDYAVWRRIKMVSWATRFEGPTRDLQMIDKLKEEWPGILSWAIEGCREWMDAGRLQVPAAVEAATREYKEDMDTVGRFLRDYRASYKRPTPRLADLHEEYVVWCKRTQHQPFNDLNFERQLAGREGIEVDDGYVHGLRVEEV